MQQLSTGIFALQPACADLVLYYWSKVVQATNGPPEHIAGIRQSYCRRLNARIDVSIDSSTAVFPVRFILQAMILFKESLGQCGYTFKRSFSRQLSSMLLGELLSSRHRPRNLHEVVYGICSDCLQTCAAPADLFLAKTSTFESGKTTSFALQGGGLFVDPPGNMKSYSDSILTNTVSKMILFSVLLYDRRPQSCHLYPWTSCYGCSTAEHRWDDLAWPWCRSQMCSLA